ncbi:hypothetical protein LTR91_003245 [Friedmanniomyces endolithicus]|uniref:Uncharacterized protein n=1 Tax=Friedmanniomyces endolithicus TaxID=329885 RepID=A0AAN6KZU2_9PEZI|nr:hypothetical protein LTR94_023678 [Friedmanniomyces endolithicus]KAK0769193.1 hypothetical protein LTR38_017947 [Friedmanniomyces endolithicus]KAK0781494.1 hypothetical protein LTR59_012481 [Friedmanniomyces endolithicus]KAK0796885.1 hypothetical protein LTR75_010033 [Friedmanniomyces endolithicus]KAK0852244.1 hypothetical protein LTR03_003505 [Friedmanniomyces endolithicus]
MLRNTIFHATRRTPKMTTIRRPGQPVHLVLDWDGTLTVKDTMALLGGLPRARDLRLYNQRLYESESEPPSHLRGEAEVNGLVDPTPYASANQWDGIVAAYMEDYRAHKALHYPVTPKERPQEERASPDQYSRWLESLKVVEYASAERVTTSGFFRGVSTEDVASVARDALDSGALQLRKGWTPLFEMSVPQTGNGRAPPINKISIISVNWSESLIRWSLFLAAERLTHLSAVDKAALLAHINDTEIHSNEIHGLNSPQGSSGRLTGNIRTAREKAGHMPAGSDQRGAAATKRQRLDSPFVVYVGDSATDYECFQCADLPIWISDQGEEEDVRVRRFDAIFRPLNTGHESGGFRPYHVEGWAELTDRGDADWCAWADDLRDVADWLKSIS